MFIDLRCVNCAIDESPTLFARALHNCVFFLLKLEEFRERENGNLGVGEPALNQVIEKAKVNLKWMERNYRTIWAFLKANGPAASRSRKAETIF